MTTIGFRDPLQLCPGDVGEHVKPEISADLAHLDSATKTVGGKIKQVAACLRIPSQREIDQLLHDTAKRNSEESSDV